MLSLLRHTPPSEENNLLHYIASLAALARRDSHCVVTKCWSSTYRTMSTAGRCVTCHISCKGEFAASPGTSFNDLEDIVADARHNAWLPERLQESKTVNGL